MALNTEPADPTVREEQHLAPKSYADAADEALDGDDGDDVFDEAAIKETPPPSALPLNHSEPRSLGEIVDEDEVSLPPNSPTLRHVIGRLEKEKMDANGNYAGAVKDAKPSTPKIDDHNALGHNYRESAKKGTKLDAIPDAGADAQNGHSYAGAVKDDEPSAPKVAGQNGSRDIDATKVTESTAAHVADGSNGNGPSYAGAVKEAEPTAPHVDEQDGPRAADESNDKNATATPNGSSYAEAVKDAEPTAPHVDEQNGPRDSDVTKETESTAESNTNGQNNDSYVKPNWPLTDKQNVYSNSNGVASEKQEEAPTSYSGVGSDDTPRSPTHKKAHKRVSSRALNGTAKKQAEPPTKDGVMDYQREWAKGITPGNSDASVGTTGVLFEEKYRSKSGQNLTTVDTTVDANNDLNRTSLQSREDKAITTEPDARPRHKRKNSELVSGRRAGEGWATSAIRWAPANVPLQRRLQTLMVLVHTLSIAGGLALFFLLCTIPLLWPILMPYLIYVLLSNAPTSGELSHRSERFRNARIWSLFASYYPARLHRTVPLQPTRKYIFGYHPHGIISHGAFAAFATEALGFKQLFPGITNTLLTLDANFRVPLYRDYALRMGLASVSRESCENILSKGGRNGEGMGRAITIVVGGARESLDAKPGSLKLVLKKRKGFVKLAIRQGADLVPVLAFGENDLYEQFDSASHPYVHKAQLMVKKFMGFTVPLFHARGVFNYDVGLMPYRRPINVVVGEPIPIVQNANPDPAYVDKIHAKYMEELLRIWDEWKDTFARTRLSELEIVE